MRKPKHRILVLLAVLGAAADPAAAQQYAGGVPPTGTRSGELLSVAREGDQVRARIQVTVTCPRVRFPLLVLKAAGAVTGERLVASSTTRLQGGRRVRVRIAGLVQGDRVFVEYSVRSRGCRTLRGRGLQLRQRPAPAGAPTKLGPGTSLLGMTDQSTAGLPMAVALRVTNKGDKVVGLWQGYAPCGRGPSATIANYSPAMRISSTGTFRLPERYRVSFAGSGFEERYTVYFGGRLLADGATGTLRIRVRITDLRGRTLTRCDSGTRRWTAGR
jgi:hypothetical protein